MRSPAIATPGVAGCGQQERNQCKSRLGLHGKCPNLLSAVIARSFWGLRNFLQNCLPPMLRSDRSGVVDLPLPALIYENLLFVAAKMPSHLMSECAQVPYFDPIAQRRQSHLWSHLFSAILCNASSIFIFTITSALILAAEAVIVKTEVRAAFTCVAVVTNTSVHWFK